MRLEGEERRILKMLIQFAEYWVWSTYMLAVIFIMKHCQ